MATQVTLRSGDRAPIPSPRRTPGLLGTCALGVLGQSYTFDVGDDVVGTLGPGKLSSAILYLQSAGGSRVVASPTDPTYYALPAVSHLDADGSNSPTGPAVTIALTGSDGPYDDAGLLLRVTSDGGLGAAGMDLAYDAPLPAHDGASFVESFVVPSARPAVLRGTIDLSLGGLDLEGLTFVTTAPAAETLTFAAGSLAASTAGLHAAITSSTSTSQVLAAALITGGKTAILANPRRIKFTTGGGTAADVPATVDIVGTDRNGNTQSETLALSQTAAAVLSVKVYATIVSLDFPVGQGTGGTVAIGYSSGFADAAEVVTAFNALAVAAPLLVRARIPDVVGGEDFLELYTTAAGSAVSLTVDAATSTAEAFMGFSSGASNLDADGADATRTFPALGITATFASGTYATDETYSAAIQGPRSSVSALNDAAIAAHDEFDDHPFGFLATVEDFSTNTAACTALTTLAGLAATWTADETSPIFVDVLVGTKFHATSAVRATHTANVAAFDADLVEALGHTTANLESMAVDDVYIGGSAILMPGTFRRSATWPGAAKRASASKIAANPGDGLIVGGSLVGPGKVLARNDAKASTKLGGLAGPGVWALKSTSAGLNAPKFGVCATRAGATSRLRSPGAGVAVGLEIARVVFGEVEFYEAQTWEGDPANPKAASSDETDPRRDHLRAVLNDVLFPSGQDPNVSAFDVALSAPTALDDGIAAVVVTYNPLIEIETVVVTITATGAVIQGAPA